MEFRRGVFRSAGCATGSGTHGPGRDQGDVVEEAVFGLHRGRPRSSLASIWGCMAPAATRRADIGRPDLAATRPSRPGRRRTDGAPRMIVVTGGAGFIGSNLLAALEERGERDLVVCDRLGGDGKWGHVATRELADIDGIGREQA